MIVQMGPMLLSLGAEGGADAQPLSREDLAALLRELGIPVANGTTADAPAEGAFARLLDTEEDGARDVESLAEALRRLEIDASDTEEPSVLSEMTSMPAVLLYELLAWPLAEQVSLAVQSIVASSDVQDGCASLCVEALGAEGVPDDAPLPLGPGARYAPLENTPHSPGVKAGDTDLPTPADTPRLSEVGAMAGDGAEPTEVPSLAETQMAGSAIGLLGDVPAGEDGPRGGPLTLMQRGDRPPGKASGAAEAPDYPARRQSAEERASPRVSPSLPRPFVPRADDHLRDVEPATTVMEPSARASSESVKNGVLGTVVADVSVPEPRPGADTSGVAPTRDEHSASVLSLMENPEDVARSLAGEIRHLALTGSREAVLRLRPPELGEMRIRLSLDSGRLTVDMTVESAPVRAAVVDNLGQLEAALAERGFQGAAVSIEVGDGSTQGGSSGRASSGGSTPARRDRVQLSGHRAVAVAGPVSEAGVDCWV